MRYIPVLLIQFYQKFISPFLPPSCRFYPSCSEYSKQAFLQHGIFYGTYLTVHRILRCNPHFEGGFDPVPNSNRGSHGR
ncbi:MAG: membrane protein insertion efficiency factor YidD [Leptospiraceae bacterium]|nr:membrane protein insertion efficiency factor YidD [Leptospiraceae bacterium]